MVHYILTSTFAFRDEINFAVSFILKLFETYCLPSTMYIRGSVADHVGPPRVDSTPPLDDLRRTLFGVRSHSLYAQI